MTAYAPRNDIDLEWIVRNMVGENFDLGSPPTGYDKGKVALRIENLSVPAPGGYSAVDRLSLDVRAGEIVCIYGLMGAGRTEMMECVAGRLQALGRPGAAARPRRRRPLDRRAHRRRPRPRPRGPAARRPRADDDRRPEPLARLDRRLHPRPLHLEAARAGPGRPLDQGRPHQDRRRRRDDRLAFRRQPAEGRDRQDAGDQPLGRPARRALAAASTSAPSPRSSSCSPKARSAASPSSTRPPRSASAFRSPTASS